MEFGDYYDDEECFMNRKILDIHCYTVEDELKTSRFQEWMKKYSLIEMEEMEKVYRNYKKLNQIISAVLDPSAPMPKEVENKVREILSTLKEIEEMETPEE